MVQSKEVLLGSNLRGTENRETLRAATGEKGLPSSSTWQFFSSATYWNSLRGCLHKNAGCRSNINIIKTRLEK